MINLKYVENAHSVHVAVRALHVMQAGHKLRSYALFKVSLCKEAYIICVKGRNALSLLARFPMGVLLLRIESARYELCGAL